MAELIPESIVAEILLRVPVKPLFRFKCVSKSWKHMISEPSFEKKHNKLASATHNLDNLIVNHSRYPPKMELFSDHQLSQINFDASELHLIGSCNGVVCLATPHRLILWNPSTGKKFTVPPNPHSDKSDQLRFCNEFKIINIVGSSVHVYSLSTNSWKDAGNTFPPMVSGEKSQQAVVYGSAHWCSEAHVGVGLILAFDPRYDQFKIIPLPPVGQSRTWTANLGGCLAVIAEAVNEDFEVWVMREYDVVASWTKEFVVPGVGCSFKCIWKNRLVFLLERECELAWYDPKSKSFNTIFMADSVHFDVITYVQSMVSVESPAPAPAPTPNLNPSPSRDSEVPPGTDWYISGLTDMGVYY